MALVDPQEIAVVCHGGRGDTEQVARLLSEAGAVQLVEYASLAEAFETAPDTLVAVLLVDPAEALARRMSEGEEPMAALAGWRAESGALLAACNRVRRKVVLLPAAADSAAAALAGYLDLALLPVPETVSGAAQEQPAETSLPPVLRVLAGALLAADPEACEIREDLEARLPPVSGQTISGVEAVDAACRAYLDLTAQGLTGSGAAGDKEMVGRIERLEHEEMLLRETLAHAKAEFEALLIERGVLQKLGEEAEWKAAQAEDALKSQRTARDEVEGLARMAGKEVETLRNELEASEARRAGIQEELDQARMALRQQQDAAEAGRAGVQEELDLTRDALRLVQDELNGQIEDGQKREQADLMVKNSLRAAHQAQLASQRERSALRENILGRVLLEEDHHRVGLRGELAQAVQAASETEAGLRARITTLETELTRVYNSRSWRITEPLRSASSGLRGKPER